MIKSMFFGIYVGVTMTGAILIDDDGEHPWSAAWFVMLSWFILTICM